MTDLQAAIDALVKPQTSMVLVGDVWRTVPHEPLLTQLEEAVRSSFGGSSAGGSTTTGLPLNSDAFARLTQIGSQLADWCRQVGVRPVRRPIPDLLGWAFAFHGHPDGYTTILERWARDIRELLDPPKRIPLEGGCVACGAARFVADDGASSEAVIVEYDQALVNLDRAAAEATMRARCRVCDVVWVGADAITELMEELRQESGETMADGAVCCTDGCCGPGSWCCGRANPHDHPELAEELEPDHG